MTYAPLKRPERVSAAGAGVRPVARRGHPVHARSTHAVDSAQHGENGPSGPALVRALGPGRLHDFAASGLSGRPVELPFLAEIQRSFGMSSLNAVKAFVGGAASRVNEQLGSAAFTVGDRVAFARPPDLWMAAHEAAHVVQQRAGAGPTERVEGRESPQERQADAIADRVSRGESAAPFLDQIRRHGVAAADGGASRRLQFFSEQQRDDGSTWRISDDMKMALRLETGEPNRRCYATADRIASAEKVLTGQGSSITLTASPSDAFSLGDNRLLRVIPTNSSPDGTTSGNDQATGMRLIPECGYAANTVMQGQGRQSSGIYHKGRQQSPRFGAYEFTGGVGLSRPASAGSGTQTQTARYDYEKDHGVAALKSPQRILGDILIDSFGGDFFAATRAYQALHKRGLPAGEPDFAARMLGQSRATRGIDEQLGINRHAQPALGEAYVIVNDPLDEFPIDPNHKPFNFHWAAVILRSGGDTVTLENATGSGYDGWSYEMYGPVTKEGQTFHEQQSLMQVGSDTGLFGENPITIRVRPETAKGGLRSTRWSELPFSRPSTR